MLARPVAFSLLVIGAHPDDCEFGAGGLAALCLRAGCAVSFVSLTNGDAGHHQIGGGPLARRRLEETRAVAEQFQLTYTVLDHHDGELVPSLDIRGEVIDLIRRFAPDLILTHRPWDYHPDHRAAAQLVQDAVGLVAVPDSRPLTPRLPRRPVLGYLYDHFQRPCPFAPGLVIATDPVIADKARMLHAHASQVYEWLPFIGGQTEDIPAWDVLAGEAQRLAWIQATYLDADQRLAEQYRPHLIARYGEGGDQVRYAEAFELSEYGRRWTQDLEARFAAVWTFGRS